MGKQLVRWRFYRLYHEATPEMVYIGITSTTLEQRKRQHLQRASNQQLAQWLTQLGGAGETPHMCLFGCLEDAEGQEAEQQEALLVSMESAVGKALLNVCHLPRDWENEDMLLSAQEGLSAASLALTHSPACEMGSMLCCVPTKSEGYGHNGDV